MATYDFRILLETVEGRKTSYVSQSFVDTSTDLVLSASQVYHRITGSVSCSYEDSTIFNGTIHNPSAGLTTSSFKDNTILSASLTGSLDTGSIVFTSTNTDYDRLKRYMFIGDKVCNVLGLPSDQWIYVDQLRFPADEESNYIEGNITAQNISVTDTFKFASSANLNSDVPILIDTVSDRYIKFIDTRDVPEVALKIGYNDSKDYYEISGSPSSNLKIGGISELTTTNITASGGISSSITSTGSFGRVEASVISGDTGVFTNDLKIKSSGGTLFFAEGTGDEVRIQGSLNQLTFFSGSSRVMKVTGDGAGNPLVGIGDFGATADPPKALTVQGDISASGDLFIQGSITATAITSSHITSSTLVTSGSNIFGDEITDTHKFNGHITASGNISSSGTIVSKIYNAIQGGNGSAQGLRFDNTTHTGLFGHGNFASLMAAESVTIHIDSNNNGTGEYFNVVKNQKLVGQITNELFRVQEDGKVGIGTTSPLSNLHIKKDDHASFRIDSSGGTDKDTTIRFTGSAQTWDVKQYAQGSVSDGQYGFHIVDITNSKFPFSIQPNNASKTLVLSGSNVGIGTSTPTKALEVVGDISASGDIFVGDDLFIADAGVINYNNSEIEIKHDGPRLVISGSGATELQVEGISDLNGAVDIDGGDLTVGSALQLTSGGVFTFGSGLDNGRITWGSEFASLYGLADNKLRLGSFNVQGVLTISSSTENTMVISGSNVGIGTSDPTKTLTVEGEISASNDLTIDDGTRSLLYDVSAHKLKFGGANAEITAGGYNLKFIANTDGAGATDGFIFTTGSDAIPLMKMQTNGNIGIGTTSPGEALEVIGNISASVTSTGSFGHITTDGRVDVGSRLNVSNAVSNFHSLNVGGGYGATGVSISTAGAIQMNNKLTVDGDISGSADSTGSFGRVDTVDGSIFGNRYVLSTQTIAAAGDAQGNATLVDVDGGSTVFVTGGDDAKGVRLPVVADSIIGQTFTIHNTATSALKVYPGSGDKILPAADNTAIEIAGSAAVIVTHFSADGFVGYEPAVIVSD